MSAFLTAVLIVIEMCGLLLEILLILCELIATPFLVLFCLVRDKAFPKWR